MPAFIYIVAAVAFTATLFVRMTDPIVPQIALDLRVDVQSAALLGTAFALPWALLQPLLGPVGDLVGKARVITVCLAILSVAGLAGAFAPTFPLLLTTRIISGMAAGGVFPVAIALISDRVAMQTRQIAISRLILGSVTGMLAGSLFAGILADFVSWRGIFFLVAACNAIAAFAAWYWLDDGPDFTPHFNIAEALANYGKVFSNPLSKFCFGAVFVEGLVIYGIFPYIALLLTRIGETRASIAGVVVASFGIGGILYALMVSRVIGRAGPRGLMIGGGLLAGAALITLAALPPWQVQAVALMSLGLGFFALHASIQTQMTELAPEARGTTVAMHSFFYFLGQALGPIVYLAGFRLIDAPLALLAGGVAIIAVGLITPRLILPARA
ncbi:purine efflux pump PbuE [Variibacter gotjawalensis]|uniref:Purine efflux pump PbuE n=1 Tax=Variibacter gotjawalensis TaxID=1333996 RepID=A0A0S3PWK3_9BRAD|nr:MFS transporter [Variibacter gotjawalensis]NIK46140.1 putative MFS family arabinose efflux permease [Variibacter gotjawalensis]RZS48058.1 putative MFS family arabinose efflux permease [Variibacter gotjawalensis]BAT60314.1 purine efflux pump PbuE [Variibacter gotjawalensis]